MLPLPSFGQWILSHNADYVALQQIQPFNPFAMLIAGGDDVDSGGVNVAVSQQIRQNGDVLFCFVKGAGEELS